MNRPMFARMLLALALTAGAASCGGDDERPEECQAIAEACHDVDTGVGMIHECHEGAESDWSQSECVAMSADCLAACAAQ